jgi:hypothetical protein
MVPGNPICGAHNCWSQLLGRDFPSLYHLKMQCSRPLFKSLVENTERDRLHNIYTLDALWVDNFKIQYLLLRYPPFP